jgi:predicted regulator of Ras-like GTPase activity (Roadblock/LC7/MglB family)
MQTALSEESSRQIHTVLTVLLEKVEAEAVFLCDRGGNIVAEHSIAEYAHAENIGALAAGSFYATLEMARLIGEPKFRCMNHQGERMSIYMEGLNEEMLLVVIFSKDSNVGLVKLYAKDASRKLAKFNIDVLPEGGQGLMHSVKLEVDESAQPFVRSKDA